MTTIATQTQTRVPSQAPGDNLLTALISLGITPIESNRVQKYIAADEKNRRPTLPYWVLGMLMRLLYWCTLAWLPKVIRPQLNLIWLYVITFVVAVALTGLGIWLTMTHPTPWVWLAFIPLGAMLVILFLFLFWLRILNENINVCAAALHWRKHHPQSVQKVTSMDIQSVVDRLAREFPRARLTIHGVKDGGSFLAVRAETEQYFIAAWDTGDPCLDYVPNLT